jgi:hypothetical protein
MKSLPSLLLIFTLISTSQAETTLIQTDAPTTQRAATKEIPLLTYIGNVGKLDAIFHLKWLPDGTVQGYYYYPKRGAEKSYLLLGNNHAEGKLYLEEYTDKNLSARIYLTKSVADGNITWSGTMHNLDGRTLNINLSRDR